MSKSRLAPVNQKAKSIPKLELQAALIASHLKVKIVNEFKIPVRETFMWTESKVVLHYLNNEDRNLGACVAHRVNEILENTNKTEWYYVSTESNVADSTTRYQDFRQLSLNSVWFQGPKSLLQENFFSPKDLNTFSVITINIAKTKVQNFTINWEYYSSLLKSTRNLAWIIKLKRNWINWKKGESHRENFTFLKLSEIKESRSILLHLSQKESFRQDVLNISSNKSVKKTSKILSLTPFLDHRKYLCVGGRLKHADIPANSKNQIILSKNHYLSYLLIKEIHVRNAHVGREHTLSLLRKHFWIVACRTLIRKLLSNCLCCCRQFVKPYTPLMGNIPKERLFENCKPFRSTDIDYFGPIKVKATKHTRRNPSLNKRYGVIFVCHTMRAMHLELADNLTTELFTLARL